MSLVMFTRSVGSSWVHAWSHLSCLQHVLGFGVCICTSWKVVHRIHQLLRGLTWGRHCCGAEKANWSWKLFGASRNYHRLRGLAWSLWVNTSNISTGISQCPRTRHQSENSLWVWTLFPNNGIWRIASWSLDEAVLFFFPVEIDGLLTAENWETTSSSFACLLFTQTVTCFISMIFQKHAGSLTLNDHPIKYIQFLYLP